jgi:hypothetical protein
MLGAGVRWEVWWVVEGGRKGEDCGENVPGEAWTARGVEGRVDSDVS